MKREVEHGLRCGVGVVECGSGNAARERVLTWVGARARTRGIGDPGLEWGVCTCTFHWFWGDLLTRSGL